MFIVCLKKVTKNCRFVFLSAGKHVLPLLPYKSLVTFLANQNAASAQSMPDVGAYEPRVLSYRLICHQV